MSTTRRSFSRRSSAADDMDGGGRDDDDATGSASGMTHGADHGYVRVFLKPLERGSYSVLLGWLAMKLGLGGREDDPGDDPQLMASVQQLAAVYGVMALVVGFVVYQLLMVDVGYLFQRLCGIVEPIFTIMCAFYWLALYLRRTWNSTSIYVLFCACFAGELLGQLLADAGAGGQYITQPFLALVVLVAVSVASMFSGLETSDSVLVIGLVSVLRFVACTSLSDLPQVSRPFLAYLAGIIGTIGAKYVETTFRPAVATSPVGVTGSSATSPDGKIPIIKRRRSSSSTAHSFSSQRAGRRTSLPALIQKSQTSASSYESAIIGEAHGLITDMLADSSLPPHVVSGLHAVSNLLKPQESHGPVHKPRISPLVSLTETTNYGSDSEDLPYTGERPSSLPKRLRRSLPPSLIRRMSTSTWTTTTSATGLPTLEPEPCRTRSCSFRHSRDNTPGSSPTGSRSNSPSPGSPTTISLTIPKSRSFSSSGASGSGSGQAAASNQKRASREYHGFYQSSEIASTGGRPSDKASPATKDVGNKDLTAKSPQAKDGLAANVSGAGLSKRFNITSDYESSDSPGSSDHSDNVMTIEEIGGPVSPARLGTDVAHTQLINTHTTTNADFGQDGQPKITNERSTPVSSALSCQASITASSDVSLSHHDKATSSASSPSSFAVQGGVHQVSTSSQTLLSEAAQLVLETERSSAAEDKMHTSVLPFTMNDVMENKLLDINKLNEWDYPIFDLSLEVNDCILSMVACRLFSETGLFETFRIPVDEFIAYFHALELGYRDKPYHNRIHATDVLHGVYYLTTQPIPGFQQINPDGDVFHSKASSSESESDGAERGCMRTNFTAEDTYGILGGNLPPLELMALYTAAAMHDYDHPGRTNAFLVATNAPLAILYNDRSVLESHHAASAWRLYLTNPSYHWLVHLDKAEFKRFRFLVIEAILATDLKRHFELLAEFNAKANDEDAPGIDWTVETDRLMASNMIIKMADINGPAKRKDLHFNWTNRISEEFYEQGDEEQSLGLPISPYMDRKHPQLAKLQESFINHLVAPLCNALGAAGLLPGTWVEGVSDGEGTDTDKSDGGLYKDTDDESDHSASSDKKKYQKKIHCWLTKNLKDNHDMWVMVLKQGAAQKDRENKPQSADDKKEGRNSLSLADTEPKSEMEPITEEDTPPNSAHSLADELTRAVDKLVTVESNGEPDSSSSKACQK